MDLKMKDVAELLDVTETTIQEWVKEGSIPHHQVENQLFFNKEELKEWVLKTRHPMSNRLLDLCLTDIPVGLTGLFDRGGLYTGIKGTTIQEIIRNAVNVIPIPVETTREGLVSLLMEREEIMPTAIGSGVAIPHPRSPIVTESGHECVSVCFLEKPLEYGAPDNIPVSVLFIIFSANAKRHLEILSHIAFLCQHEEFLTLLASKPTKEGLLKMTAAIELQWKEVNK